MNFEVFCFGWIHDSKYNCESLSIVQKEYFDTYAEAVKFEETDGKKYDSVSITPMNFEAECEMQCVECGGKWGLEKCKTCRYR